MESNIQRQNEENVGYLIIRASTARGAIPLPNAAVSIRGAEAKNSGMLFSLSTNDDGLTQKIALPSPDRALSESPGNPSPFSSWNVDVFKEGYIPISFSAVPVYSGVVSVQPAIMVPIPENFRVTQSFNESSAPEL